MLSFSQQNSTIENEWEAHDHKVDGLNLTSNYYYYYHQHYSYYSLYTSTTLPLRLLLLLLLLLYNC